MQHIRIPAADRRRRREAFLDLVARAALAPSPQREDLLTDAATIASLYLQFTGTPLLPDVPGRLRVGDEAIPPR